MSETDATDRLRHVSAFDPLPPGLDPRTVDDDLLRKHGLPRRPNPDLEPQALRQWNRIMARPTRVVRAELEVDAVMSARHDHRAAPGQIWGGVVREACPGTDYTQPATMIFAEWVVPEVSAVAPEGPDLTVAFWIGLDGYQGEAGQVLQAGVAATVSPGWWSSSVSYWAWIEWYTGEYMSPPVKVTNFAVAPGDTVSFLVTTEGQSSGAAFMRNNRTGIGTSVGIEASPGIVSAGQTAEWVMEEASDFLPYFGQVTFTNCWAGSFIEGASEYFRLEPGGLTAEIVGIPPGQTLGKVLTKTTIVSPTVAVVDEIAVDWG
jgi:Peptidase A4 family